MGEESERFGKWLTGAPMNSGTNITENHVSIAVPGGWQTVNPNDNGTVRYVRDPDQFAADQVGLSKERYREWVALDGAALCGERMKSGTLCRNLISGTRLPAHQWNARHRQGVCHSHEGAMESRAAER
jgi:hypothetical protein